MEHPDSPWCEVSTILIAALKNKDVILNVLLLILLLLFIGSSDEDLPVPGHTSLQKFVGRRHWSTIVFPHCFCIFTFTCSNLGFDTLCYYCLNHFCFMLLLFILLLLFCFISLLFYINIVLYYYYCFVLHHHCFILQLIY